MLDIGGRQQLRQTYLAGQSYPEQDELLSSNLECPHGCIKKDANPVVPASLSDFLSQPRCQEQLENTKQISLFSTEEQQLLQQQLCSLPEGLTVCQCLTMTTNSSSSKISDSSTSSATITPVTISTAAVSELVQNQNIKQLAPNPMPTLQSSDPSFFLSLSKHSPSFCSSSHQTQCQKQKSCFLMSPERFPLQQQQQQQYHFLANVALPSSKQHYTDSFDGKASSQGNPNCKCCSGEAVDGANQKNMIAFITNRLKKQELTDNDIATPVANPSGYVHAEKDSQVCHISISPTSWLYPSSPLKKSVAPAYQGSDPWSISLDQGPDLQATVKGLLGLRLGERIDQCVTMSPHQLTPSSNNDTIQIAYSSSHCSSVQTEKPVSDKLNDSGVESIIGISTCNDADTLTDMSPGTPPDPPKKKHCRSLSIPSGSSSNINSRSRRSAGGISTDHPKNTDANRCCTSLLKPTTFTPASEASNLSKVQQQQNLPFLHYSGQGTSTDVQKTRPSPLSPNTNMSSSLTSLLQPTSFRGLFSSTQLSGSVSTSQNGSLSLAALVTTPASTPVSSSQLHVAPSQMSITMLTSSPPLTSDNPSFQTLSSSPPDSPVPRPASVSVVGCRCEDDTDSRAFKPVLDPWLCRSQSRGNSGFSSPSSCSSSSSFLLVPPQSDPRSNTEIQSSTLGGLLAAPVPLTQTQHSSPTCTPCSFSSPASVTGIGGSLPQAPLQSSYWMFQKHRSFSLEEQLSQMGKPTSTSPSFITPSPPSSSSSVLSSPSYHHHHNLCQLPAPVFQTQQYQPSYTNDHHQQQQPQLPPPQPPQPPQTVSAGGSTPSVPVACKSSISNPSSPRRQRIPRCRSQPCVLHDRREGRKRRRDYDRPTLDFHKMTQTAYSLSLTDSSDEKSCIKQEPWTILHPQKIGDNTGLWSTSSLVAASTLNTVRISTMQPAGPISLEVLRKTDFLASEHGDDPLSEDAEISAATEAAEAAARAAASAATITKTTTVATTIITTAAVNSTVPAAMTTTAVAMDDEDGNWGCPELSRPDLFARAMNPIGQDMSVYVSDESNPSFCGCDDDDDDDDDEEDDDHMDSDERVDRGVNFQRTNQCMFPITDLDLNQIENH